MWFLVFVINFLYIFTFVASLSKIDEKLAKADQVML